MRDGKWKMIVSSNQFELYDLSRDIGETTNLASTYPSRARAMRMAIESWKNEVQWKANQQGR